MNTKAHFKKLIDIVREECLLNALNYDILVTRNRNAFFDELYSLAISNSGTKYNKSHIVAYNGDGKIRYFKSKPVYPRDFVPI